MGQRANGFSFPGTKTTSLLVSTVYAHAQRLLVHPFLEFVGVMRAYVKSCERARVDSLYFSECNAHAGQQLPMKSFEATHLNEKLNGIFDGRVIAIVDAADVAKGLS